MTTVNQTSISRRAVIEAALPRLHFERITSLFFVREDGEEVEEFAPQRGLLISASSLPREIFEGNKVANASEIWLHPDGSLHKYLWSSAWESLEYGCTQRRYVGPVGEETVSLEDLLEQIEINLAEDSE
jgi:hypothetical protein